MTVKFGLLGAGRIGKVHAKAITGDANAKLVAVADAFPATAQAIADQYGCDVRTIDAICAAKDIDAVVICTPTDTHADLIERFVKAGKAVFCEKPVDLDVARVEACLRAVEAAGGKLMVGFNRRFDPHFRAAQAAIADGTIGTVEMVTITSRDPGAPPVDYIKRSGGIFRDMTIHDFDMARFILGEEPVEVSATASRLVDPALMARLGDYDTLTVTLKTASGKQAVITNSRQSVYGYDQRVEALGSKGMAISENRRPHQMTLHTVDFTDRAEPLLNFFIERYREAFDAEIDAFVDAIEQGIPPEVGFEDGRLALVLAEAALKSVAEGRVVRTSEVG